MLVLLMLKCMVLFSLRWNMLCYIVFIDICVCVGCGVNYVLVISWFVGGSVLVYDRCNWWLV